MRFFMLIAFFAVIAMAMALGETNPKDAVPHVATPAKQPIAATVGHTPVGHSNTPPKVPVTGTPPKNAAPHAGTPPKQPIAAAGGHTPVGHLNTPPKVAATGAHKPPTPLAGKAH